MIEVSESVYQGHVNRVMADEGQMPAFHDHNPVCPFCGRGDSLRAYLSVTYMKVPLRTDGYVPEDGQFLEDEIIAIECAECDREIPVGHYQHSADECDCDPIGACVQRVMEWLSECEEE